jgi:hypothetical protein
MNERLEARTDNAREGARVHQKVAMDPQEGSVAAVI